MTDRAFATACYRCMTLQQILRARRGGANVVDLCRTPLQRDVFLLIEAHSVDMVLASELPGLRQSLVALREYALAARPSVSAFSPPRRGLERLVRQLLQSPPDRSVLGVPSSTSPMESLATAANLVSMLAPDRATERALGTRPLLKDWWTGELVAPDPRESKLLEVSPDGADVETTRATRSGRLRRRPEVRNAEDDEDEHPKQAAPWIVHPDHPHPLAEDPVGLQRPADGDDETPPEDFADMVSELSEARLVSTPGKPREVLLSNDPPSPKSRYRRREVAGSETRICYPEWDYRVDVYRDPGATVHLRLAEPGPQAWVDATLIQHRALLTTIRRQFELLRAEPKILRRRMDGEEVDFDAYLESYADFRAGLSRSEALYQTQRRARRSLAITVLVDVSGSTDSWISGDRRVIDVEREALLLVCLALEELGEPYSVQAFSGDGPQAVSVWELKRFEKPYGNDIALRIAALEPERYTRAGAALRHATTSLVQQRASHQLLLMLSDGKPNDLDEYGGRYGVEDVRQAVVEARLQGVFPFCLTIDKQAANYLPRVFGAHHYGLLPKPELLPRVLLDWIKRLLAT